MKFKYLGTAAAEVVPALWCTCDTCRKCRQNGGKDIRRRASYLIDDDTMVDFGPDANWQVREFGIDLSAIRRLLITHPHEDHLDPAARGGDGAKEPGKASAYDDEVGLEAAFGYGGTVLFRFHGARGINYRGGRVTAAPAIWRV